MTEIYLVRHGEAEGNLYRRCQGWYDSLLTKKAVEKQLPEIRKRFSDIKLDAVYSSDIYRAYSTVLPIAQEHGLEVIPEKGFRELYMGDWEDRTWGELPRLYPREMDAWENRPWEVRLPGGETYEAAGSRFWEALLRVANKHDGQTVLIGTHGSVMRATLAKALYGTLKAMKNIEWCDNTGVCLLRFDNGALSVVFYNCNKHLDEESSTFFRQRWWRKSAQSADSNFWFRPADLKTDREKILLYRREFLESTSGVNYKPDTEKFFGECAKLQSLCPRTLQFAMLHERELGLLQLDAESLKRESCGLIKTYIIDKEAREKGFSVQLMGEAISVFRNAGMKFLGADISEKKHEAVHFLEKDGFMPTEARAGRIIMKKSIEVNNPAKVKKHK
ncbi:MAG: histidine phosphatase family protein [Bacillota bacterium]|nr:histidine phosphatase family protein [Bacillota bacterium]